MMKTMSLCSEIQDYIDLVRSGKIRVCRDQIKLVNLVERAFATENIYVDEVLVKKYMCLQDFFPFKLFPWEKFCFVLHNCVFRHDGFLRWPELHIFVGRGSGKNGYSSFEQFANSSPVNGVGEYHILTVAAAEDNAKQSFDELYNIFESDPKRFKKYFRWSLTKIVNLKTKSEIKFGTSAPKSKDGGRRGEIIIDEEHSYQTFDLINVLEDELGKKAKSRMLKISSFGDVRDGPMDDDVENDEKILDGLIEDNGTLPFICRLDADEEVHDEENWVKACPSIIYLPNLLEEYRRKYRKYKENPTAHLSFMTKRMGRPQGTSNKPVTSVENIKATNQPMIDCDGLNCIVGTDYARLNDFATTGFLFKVDEKVYWKQHTWVCAQSKNLSRVRAPLKKWEADGLLTFVDDVEIAPEMLTDWLEKEIKEHGYIPRMSALDSFRYQLMKKSFESIGFDSDKKGKNNLKLLRPSDIIKTVPVIDSYFNKKNIVFGDCPLMRWYVNNAMLKQERSGEFSYGKQEPKSRKTDGFMAFAAAMSQLDLLEKRQTTIDFEKIKVYEF